MLSKENHYLRKHWCSSADLQRHEDVSESLAVGVMAVHRQGADRHLPDDNVQHLTHAARRPHSDGVAEGDLVAAHGVQSLGNLQDDRQTDGGWNFHSVAGRPVHTQGRLTCATFSGATLPSYGQPRTQET